MAEDSLITNELKSKIGIERAPKVYEIEKGMIQRFVQAIDDQNPLWQDEKFANKSKHGGTIAPPTFIAVMGNELIQEEQSASLSHVSMLHGSTELECYQPVRAGDTITAITKISDVRERQGKLGNMILVTFATTYRNHRQELVARCQQVIIGY